MSGFTERTEEEKRESLLSDARKELSCLEAMKILIKGDDDITSKLEIGGVYHAFSDAKVFKRSINLEIIQIKRAIQGLPNTWE